MRGIATGIAAAATALIGAVGGCGQDETSAAGATVVATTTQVADLARNVAGDRAEVIGILPPNADPHDYEPRPSDAEAIARADLVVKSGGELDLWADELVESAGGDRPVDTLLDRVPVTGGGHEHADEHAGEESDTREEVDPHWWQSPRNAEVAVEAIRDRLIELDAEGRATYEENAEAYLRRLRRLDRGIRNCIRRVPAEQRKLVTTHDALGYYADRYGIEVIGAAVPALTTQAQPSAGETAELVDQIERQGVNAIFPESGLNPRLERAIADETGARVGGELWADTLGPADSTGATYIDAMAANTETMVDGLTGGAVSCRPRA